MTVQIVDRKRCPMCLSILEYRNVDDSGAVSKVMFLAHTPDYCSAITMQRIRVLEEQHHRDAIEIRGLHEALSVAAVCTTALNRILDRGRKWLEHRAKRSADLKRLRGALGTQDRTLVHPLWEAENEVAVTIQEAFGVVERNAS